MTLRAAVARDISNLSTIDDKQSDSSPPGWAKDRKLVCKTQREVANYKSSGGDLCNRHDEVVVLRAPPNRPMISAQSSKTEERGIKTSPSIFLLLILPADHPDFTTSSNAQKRVSAVAGSSGTQQEQEHTSSTTKCLSHGDAMRCNAIGNEEYARKIPLARVLLRHVHLHHERQMMRLR